MLCMWTVQSNSDRYLLSSFPFFFLVVLRCFASNPGIWESVWVCLCFETWATNQSAPHRWNRAPGWGSTRLSCLIKSSKADWSCPIPMQSSAPWCCESKGKAPPAKRETDSAFRYLVFNDSIVQISVFSLHLPTRENYCPASMSRHLNLKRTTSSSPNWTSISIDIALRHPKSYQNIEDICVYIVYIYICIFILFLYLRILDNTKSCANLDIGTPNLLRNDRLSCDQIPQEPGSLYQKLHFNQESKGHARTLYICNHLHHRENM